MSAVNEWDVEVNTRRGIPCLEATMYYFIYHINRINSPFVTRKAVFINERKYKNPPIVKCVGAKAQDGNMR